MVLLSVFAVLAMHDGRVSSVPQVVTILFAITEPLLNAALAAAVSRLYRDDVDSLAAPAAVQLLGGMISKA